MARRRTRKDEPRSPILIDPRVGSKDLYPILVRAGIPSELCPLDFGDAAFVGHGRSGPVTIGIERKRIRDLAQSLTSNRLTGHQIPGLIEGFDYAWLLIEGPWREGDNGLIEVPIGGKKWGTLQPRISAKGLIGWLTTLTLRGGIRLWQTHNPDDTALFLGTLYGWWTNKEWTEHRAHLAIYDAPDAALFAKPTLVRRLANELPGIGYDRSGAVDQHFKTPLDMVAATEGEWQTIPGIGKITAANVVKALRGE